MQGNLKLTREEAESGGAAHAGAEGIPNVEWVGHVQDPYCELTVGAQHHKSFVHDNGGMTPVSHFMQVFLFKGVSVKQQLEIKVWDKNYWWKDVLIGTCSLPICEVTGREQEFLLPVTRATGDGQQGTVEVLVQFTQGEGGDSGRFSSLASPTMRWILPPEYRNRDATADYLDWEEVWVNRYGATYRAIRAGLNARCTIKVVNKRGSSSDEDDLHKAAKEVIMLRELEGHPNVVRLYDAWETRQQVCVVTEACSGGELFEAIARWRGCQESHAAAIMRTIISLVKDLHDKGIMHRDLKPEHILLSDISKNAVVRVSGFGAATFFQKGVNLHKMVGSLMYAAPEALQESYGPEADLWSCGCILHALLAGYTPYQGYSLEGVLHAMLNQPLDVSSGVWAAVSEPAKDCVRQLLQIDPKKRPTAAQILQHPWLRENGAASDVPVVLDGLQKFSGMNKFTKLALKIVAACLPAHEKAGLRQLFNEIDVDRNGTISVPEFKEALRRRGQVMRANDVERMMAAAGFDREQLDFQDFVAIMMRNEVLGQVSLRNAFTLFDLDGNGTISMDELRQALHGQGLEQDDIPRIIAEADKDGDQGIDFNEFCAMLQKI